MSSIECTSGDPPVAEADLSGGGIDVWKTRLNVSRFEMPGIMRLLTRDEVSRAERYRFVRDRRHFVVSRLFLRTVLGMYLGCKPEAIRFVYNEQGKPELADRAAGKGLAFNFSRSHGLALCAVTRNRRIGIDLEVTPRHLEWEPVARAMFSDIEYARIRALPQAEASLAFLRQWTLKEAYSKALGKGFSLPWRDFSIDMPAGGQPQLHAEEPGSGWTLFCFEPEPAYVASIAVEGASLHVAGRALAPRAPAPAHATSNQGT